MTLKLSKFFLISMVLFLVAACNKDDDNGGGTANFMIKSDIRSGADNLLLITDQEGAVLFDTIGRTLNKTFTFDSEGNDRVDVTRAYEFNNYFTLETYRSVPSEFFITSLGVDCEDGFSAGGLNLLESISLTIEGLTNYAELHYSFTTKEEPEIDQNANTLLLKGKKYERKEVLVTLLTDVNGTYKTLWIKEEDWISGTDPLTFTLTVHIDDFVESVVHEIALGTEKDWIVNAEALDGDNQNIILANWNNLNDNQSGSIIKLFTTAEMSLEKIKLSVKSTSAWSGPQYQAVVDEFPGSIDFYNESISISDLSATNYKVVGSADHDFVKATYQYKIGNTLYSWDIYQLAEADNFYKLPTLPDSFLENASLIYAALANPERIIVTDYKSFDLSIEEQFHSTSMNRMLDCLNYRGQSTSQEF